MTTIGCIRAKMGSTTYYIAKFRVGQLVDSVGLAKEMPEWSEMNADEKMQREPDIGRVVSEMVPYVTLDLDRFFGSLIIDVYSGFEDMIFESVSDVIPTLPAAYKSPMGDMGFLTLPGNERLIALDGQHRLLSLKIAVKGFMGLPADSKVSPSWNLQPHPELANEEVSVILVEHRDNLKIRKIFNKVNRYARQTSRSDNIITSDDDIFAVISRRIIAKEGVLAPIDGIELVNWKSNTLPVRSKNLTTLSALYTISETLLKDAGYTAKSMLTDESTETAHQIVADFWHIMTNELSAFQDYLRLTKEDKPVSSLREENLLMKPVTQMALAHVARMATVKDIDWTTIAQRLNKIDWSFKNSMWFNILIIPSANKKMITGKDSIRAAGMVMSYMVMGREMSREELADTKQIIQNARDDESADLPLMMY